MGKGVWLCPLSHELFMMLLFFFSFLGVCACVGAPHQDENIVVMTTVIEAVVVIGVRNITETEVEKEEDNSML